MSTKTCCFYSRMNQAPFDVKNNFLVSILIPYLIMGWASLTQSIHPINQRIQKYQFAVAGSICIHYCYYQSVHGLNWRSLMRTYYMNICIVQSFLGSTVSSVDPCHTSTLGPADRDKVVKKKKERNKSQLNLNILKYIFSTLV